MICLLNWGRVKEGAEESSPLCPDDLIRKYFPSSLSAELVVGVAPPEMLIWHLDALCASDAFIFIFFPSHDPHTPLPTPFSV